MSIRNRLIRLSMLLATVVVLVTAAGFWIALYAAMKTELFVELISDAGRLALMVEKAEPGAGAAYSVDLREHLFAGRYSAADQDGFFEVWAADGRSLAKSASLASGELTRPSLVDQTSGPWAPSTPLHRIGERMRAENQDLELAPITLLNGKQAIMCWIRWNPMRGPMVVGPNERDEFVVVAVAREVASMEAEQRNFTVIIVSSALLALVVFRVLIGMLVSRGLRPLGLLTREVERVDAERGGRVTERGMSQETAPIARALNAMLSKTEQTLERERRFNENAAHELRTPIAEIRAVADVAKRLQGRESLMTAISDISQSAAQMEAVLSALLRISRRRTDVDQRPPTRVDVGALTSRAVKRHEASLAQRRISVMDRVGGSIVVMGDAAALGTIVSNLIDNAAEYTPEGGELSVTAELVDGTLRFDVANGPVTLTADEVERMFEPFWRRDPTRGDGEHSGLGLAIVRAMCESLDGEVIGSLEEGGRLRMRVVVGVGSVE